MDEFQKKILEELSAITEQLTIMNSIMAAHVFGEEEPQPQEPPKLPEAYLKRFSHLKS